jgi:hypothetical protein
MERQVDQYRELRQNSTSFSSGRNLGFKKASGKADATEHSYPKKYWWLILIVVPLVIALIQTKPWQLGGASGSSTTSITMGDVSVIVNEATLAGTTLSEDLVTQLRQAVEHSQAGKHSAAADSIERVRSASRQIAELPALLSMLGDEYQLSGKTDDARRVYQAAFTKDPTNARALNGLRRLPAAAIEGVKLVNFTSQLENVWDSGVARNLVDGNPESSWLSRDGQFPQTFIFEMPTRSAISEVSFNNPAYGDPVRGAKDIEISLSSQSASSGFRVVRTASLAKNDIGQGIALDGAPVGRWLKVRVLTNYGDKDHTSLGDISIVGRPQPD